MESIDRINPFVFMMDLMYGVKQWFCMNRAMIRVKDTFNGNDIGNHLIRWIDRPRLGSMQDGLVSSCDIKKGGRQGDVFYSKQDLVFPSFIERLLCLCKGDA
jgi:hypothetical protein